MPMIHGQGIERNSKIPLANDSLVERFRSVLALTTEFGRDVSTRGREKPLREGRAQEQYGGVGNRPLSQIRWGGAIGGRGWTGVG